MASLKPLLQEISSCALCHDRFAATETGHEPRPVAWLSDTAPILICGQAPGARVHRSGIPFDDPSGDRLREWMGVSRAQFYDRSKFAILPMAFCFPGYRKGADLPPPRICAKTWRHRSLEAMPQIKLTLLIGGYAQKWHIAGAGKVNDVVSNWQALPENLVPLPHPSWRNSGWLARNPWFDSDVVPSLQARIAALIA